MLMLDSYTFYQTALENFSATIFAASYVTQFLFNHVVTYLMSSPWNDPFNLAAYTRLIYAWFAFTNPEDIFNYIIMDTNAFAWLYQHATLAEAATWVAWNLQCQVLLGLSSCTADVLSKSIPVTLSVSPWISAFLLTLCKYTFFVILFLNLLFFTRSNVGGLNLNHTHMFAKFSYLVESEEELGSIDDVLFFLSFFVVLFSWFFLSSIFFVTSIAEGLNFLSVCFLTLVVFVLLIPASLLVDFGVAFAAYIRGASSNTNIFVEVMFDLLGVLVVFTRFIVQNIRFVLIFWAYFELFEWIHLSPLTALFNQVFTVEVTDFAQSNFISTGFGLASLSTLIFGLFSYGYYFVHLLVLLLIQLGAYFLISFWLFFFFYTSFYLTKEEKLFFYKRYSLLN